MVDHPRPAPRDAGRPRPDVETLGQYRNRDGGFWGASTDPLAADQALTGTIPVNQVSAAALLTDGADAVDRYGLMTRRLLLDVLAQDGPSKLISRVRETERSDPHGERWPRSKAHEHASAVFCLV
ncbi:hypothetical protein ACQPZZ_01900 [Microbispora sp. CA-135349]|uniref:hypothetical protein n=1 Tax=Microbispora sp. CA-135349 TaxID=3239953 RepID=UPI003D8B6D07